MKCRVYPGILLSISLILGAFIRKKLFYPLKLVSKDLKSVINGLKANT